MSLRTTRGRDSAYPGHARPGHYKCDRVVVSELDKLPPPLPAGQHHAAKIMQRNSRQNRIDLGARLLGIATHNCQKVLRLPSERGRRGRK
jgi:hypothetical protein